MSVIGAQKSETTRISERPDGAKETAFQVFQQPIAFNAAVRVTPKVIKEANKAKHYTVDAEYPQIEGDARFDTFNREARNLITKDVAAFRTSETSEETDAGSETPAARSVTPRQSAGALSRSFVRCSKPDMVLAFDASPWI